MKGKAGNGKYVNFIYGIWRILEWIFLLLMAVQILSGIAWLVKNIGHEALFYETQNYLKGAQELVVDEYMGILYPLLIRLAQGIERVVQVPYYVSLYVLQIAGALFSALCFLQRRGWIREKARAGKLLAVFIGAYTVTFPMLLQLHLAVLPYSLAASVSVLLISEGMYYGKHVQEICGKVLIKLCGLWMTAFLLLPDYGWLMGIFVGGVFLLVLPKNRKRRTRLLMALLSTVLCFGVIADGTQTPGSMGRMQKTIGAVMVRRFVWPNFVRDSFFWEERVNDTFAYYDLVKFAQSPEAVEYEFGPVLEEKYGKEAANHIYMEMAVTSFGLGSKQAIRNIFRDFWTNLCPQSGFQYLLEDNDASLSGWNYGRMQDNAPMIAKYYLRFSLTGWNVMCLLGILLLVRKEAGRLRRKRNSAHAEDAKKLSLSREEDVKHEAGCGVVLFACLLCLTVWYTMSNGMQDYKNVMLNSFFWLFPVIKGFLNIRERGCNDGF